ncbi:hypothetical protein BLA29_002237 [Euroglyphus maynei]|uniref:Uncharacterized protein n=1 Tax=Euroglyphus maynei TaxID=6958 RepID=A0A1Y3BHH9_EURMA|nr:hypothetical protein BLA29_002237 [Euroglyphus maynei]
MIRVMKIVLSKNARNSYIHQSSFNPSSSSSNGGGGKKSSNGHFGNNITAKQRKHSNKNVTILNEKIDNVSSTDVLSFEQRITEWLTYLRGFFGLIILMGITWISYVLYIHEFGHFFSYIFIVMNGLQGVFIFITQFIFNRKAMDAVKKKFCFGDFNNLATRNATTTSYLSQQRVSKPSLANINKINNRQQKEENDDVYEDDDDNNVLSSDRYPYNVLIDRTTSIEF